MTPKGRAPDPPGPDDESDPGRRGDAESPEADDDHRDWGYGTWETPVRARREATRADAPDERDSDDPAEGDDASDPDDGGEDRPRRPAIVERRTVHRRRVTAIAVGVVLLALLITGVQGFVRGGPDPPSGPRHLLSARLDTARALTADRIRRRAAVQRFIDLGKPVYCGAGREPWVALTFDDGPSPLSREYLRILGRAGATATAFRIGRNIPGREGDVRAERDAGWDSGSHTVNHPDLALLGEKGQRKEIYGGDRMSRKALGRPAVLFRPPYEAHDETTDRLLHRLGRLEVLWNVDTQDSLGTATADAVYRRAVQGLHPGSIILMHETKASTVAALPRILAEMKRRHLTAVTVSQMLSGDAPSRRQLDKGFAGCPVDLTPGKASA